MGVIFYVAFSTFFAFLALSHVMSAPDPPKRGVPRQGSPTADGVAARPTADSTAPPSTPIKRRWERARSVASIGQTAPSAAHRVVDAHSIRSTAWSVDLVGQHMT
jgi:hypothetical protein